MLLLVLQIALALAALYCFGTWIYTFILVRSRKAQLNAGDRAQIELFTFHLGICGIIAAGLLGLILVLQGA